VIKGRPSTVLGNFKLRYPVLIALTWALGDVVISLASSTAAAASCRGEITPRRFCSDEDFSMCPAVLVWEVKSKAPIHSKKKTADGRQLLPLLQRRAQRRALAQPTNAVRTARGDRRQIPLKSRHAISHVPKYGRRANGVLKDFRKAAPSLSFSCAFPVVPGELGYSPFSFRIRDRSVVTAFQVWSLLCAVLKKPLLRSIRHEIFASRLFLALRQ